MDYIGTIEGGLITLVKNERTYNTNTPDGKSRLFNHLRYVAGRPTSMINIDGESRLIRGVKQCVLLNVRGRYTEIFAGTEEELLRRHRITHPGAVLEYAIEHEFGQTRRNREAGIAPTQLDTHRRREKALTSALLKLTGGADAGEPAYRVGKTTLRHIAHGIVLVWGYGMARIYRTASQEPAQEMIELIRHNNLPEWAA